MKKIIYTIFAILTLGLSTFAQLQAQNDPVNMFTLRKLVKETPDQKDKILSQANEILSQPNGARLAISQYSQVAGMLLDAGIYLDNAETFAKKGLALCQLDKFIESSKEVFKKNNAPIPTDEAIAQEFTTNKARLLGILGRIQIKSGKLSEAETTLKEALKLNSMDTATAVSLSDLAEKKGDNSAAFNYLIPAVFSIGVTKEFNDRMERVYQKSNGGKADGLDELLDKKFHEAFPYKSEPYKPTDKRTNRTVLAELFTGAGCSPCVIADLAYDVILQRYKRQNFAVLVYHVHNPRPDPLANATTTDRSKFYLVRGVPAVTFDGDFTGESIGGNVWEKAKLRYEEFTAKIDKKLETLPGADLKLNISKEGSLVKVKATVDKFKMPSENLKLHIVLAEDLIKYVGENGIRFHPFVVRSMETPDAKGLTVDATKANSFEYTFDVAKISDDLRIYSDEFEKNPPKEFKYGEAKFRKKMFAIDEKNLTVVAFVQDEKTKEVLQTVYFKVK
ncbi:MAG TPA: hypothetical protein PKY82_28585 [Pyrinomonadaceae bacterium]|nr:hypothetical protein [Pyrinomonadaceae bacterium]